MTSSMGQKRWKESWAGSGGHRRGSMDCGKGRPRTGAGSDISSLTDYSLDRPNTQDTGYLLRDKSAISAHVDSTSYQEKLQGWSAFFHDSGTMLAPRPGTSLNSMRPINTGAEVEREFSFLSSGKSPAFPAKPRELYDPLEGIMPPAQLVSQRKYYVLPSIGNPSELLFRRQRSNVETLNQLDYSREHYEDDAEFFAELIELKREANQAGTPCPNRQSANPLPPIQKLRDVVRPRTNIAELDEDNFVFSGRGSASGMSDISDVDEFRISTPDPDYADTSPRKLSTGYSPVKSLGGSTQKSSVSSELYDNTDSVPPIIVENC